MALFLSQNNVAAEVALNHFPPTSGVTPPLSALPCGLSEVVRYVAQECCVSLGWATAAVLASIGISLQGTVKVRLGETFDCPVLPAFLLMGERGSGKDRTLRLVLRAIRQWENQKGTSILSARRSYVQQMRKTFEHGGFSALADGELDSLSELFSHPDHRGEILDELEGNGQGYVSQRCSFKMSNARMAFLCGAQPAILQDKIRRYRMEENGFLSRCCIVNASAPPWVDIPVPPNTFKSFEQRLQALLEIGHERLINHECHTLTLADEAVPVWQDLAQHLKRWLHPRRPLLEGWLSRAVGHTAQLAGILTLYSDTSTQIITSEMTYRAADIGKWLLNETCIAYDYLFPMPGVRAAVCIGRYLQLIQAHFVSDRQLKLALAKDITSPREIKAGISLLISICALQPGSSADGRRGRPESGYQVDVPILMDFLGC